MMIASMAMGHSGHTHFEGMSSWSWLFESGHICVLIPVAVVLLMLAREELLGGK